MWVACQTNRLHEAKAHIDRTSRPFIWRAHSRIELKTCVRRSRPDDRGVVRSNNLFRRLLPGFQWAFLSCRLLGHLILVVSVLQRRPACSGSYSTIPVVRKRRAITTTAAVAICIRPLQRNTQNWPAQSCVQFNDPMLPHILDWSDGYGASRRFWPSAR